MADYFSMKPQSGHSTPHLAVNQARFDDVRSVQSSQYLNDVLPETLTINNLPQGNGFANNANANANTNANANANVKELILPANDPRSPYFVSVPVPNPMVKPQKSYQEKNTDDQLEEYFVREYPTDILIDRFYKWKKILKGLIVYLREVSFAQEQFARINLQLKSSVKFPFLTNLEDDTNRLVDPFTTSKPIKKQQPKTMAQQKQQKNTNTNTNTNNTSNTSNTSSTSNKYNNENYDSSNNDNSFSSNTQYNLPVSPNIETENSEFSSLASSGFLKFGSGSIQDIQVVLKKHHLAIANQQLKISKEIISTLIPKLENLKRDLNFKIKEIKELHNDFKTNINSHLDLTHKLLHKYMASVKYINNLNKTNNTSSTEKTKLEPKHDPYLLKLQLDLQLKRQLAEENYLQDAFLNLQSSGMKLEKIIFSKIQNSLQRYSALIDSEARLTIKNLCHELQQGILTKPPAKEWDHFVSHHPTCLMNWKSIDPLPVPRKISEVIYPNMKSPLAKCIRAGYFHIKSNFAKDYNKGYFVLTPNYLHEFKSSNFYQTTNNSTINNGFSTSANTAISNNNTNSTNNSSNDFTDGRNASSTTSLGNPSGNISSSSITANGLFHLHPNSSLTPILSIPLNECTVLEVTENHFVLQGRAIFMEQLPKAKPATTPSSHSSSFSNLSNVTKNPTSVVYDAPKSVLAKKSAFSKLLNPGKSRQIKQEEQQRKLAMNNFTALKEQEQNSIVTWKFKMVKNNENKSTNKENITDDDNTKYFKKWIQDLKNLCAYNTTNERLKFIDERLLRLQLNRNAKRSKSAQVVPTLSDFSKENSTLTMNTTNNSINNKTNSVPFINPNISSNNEHSASTTQLNEMPLKFNKPQHIAIQNTPTLLSESSFRSKINTPAIDDNGNLITMAERKNYSFAAVTNMNNNNGNNSNGNNSGNVNSNNVANNLNLNNNIITSNTTSPNYDSENSSFIVNQVIYPDSNTTPTGIPIISPNMDLNGNSPKIGNVSSRLQPQSQSQSQQRHQRNISLPVSLGGINSPNSIVSDAGGGYFAIPVNRSNDQLNIVNTVTPPLSRTTSRGTSNIANIANASRLPKVKVSNPEVTETFERPTMDEKGSTGSLPSLTKNNSMEFYQRSNSSANNLTTTTSRVHPVRKHKKNVSFSSLNSLMFAKKGGNSSTFTGNQLIGVNIREDDDNSSVDGNTIKLNQSIYS